MDCTTNSQGESGKLLRRDQAMSRQAARRRLVVVAVCLGMLAAAFLYAPWVQDGPTMCPGKLIVGVSCPGCGLTRSFCAVASGQWSAAFSFHLLGPLLFVVAALVVPVLISEIIRRRRFELFHSILFSRRFATSMGLILFLYHGARLCSLAYSGELLVAFLGSPVGWISSLVLS